MTEAHKPGRQAHAPRHLARVFALLGFYQWIADPTLWCARQDSNPRPSGSQPDTLSN